MELGQQEAGVLEYQLMMTEPLVVDFIIWLSAVKMPTTPTFTTSRLSWKLMGITTVKREWTLEVF